MVKKEKKLFVWQKKQIKIRKKRQTKPKIYESPQQDRFQDQNNQVQIDAESQEKQEIKENKENNLQQIIKVQNNQNQIINQQKNLQSRKKIEQAIQYEQKKKKLVQKLKLVKQILFRQEYNSKDIKTLALQQCRAFQCNQIRAFLNSKQNQYTSNVLYIYGTPGSGKTFSIKAMLKDLYLQNRTKWINCLSMINRSLLKYSQPLLDQNSRKDIMVIDQFDQMQKQYKNFKFMQSFRVYLKEVLTKSCISQLSKMKFIFISNKSYQSISEQFVDAIKEIIKADSIVQIPFLPYSSGDIFKILKKKIQQIQLSIGEAIFTNNFLEISSKREYSSFQDIRKIVNFIYFHYENAEMKKFNQLNLEDTGQTFIKDINPIGILIVAMPIKQKQIFKKLVKTHELSQLSKSIIFVQWLYKQGSKLGIYPQTIDLWLQEWIQLGFLSLKSHQKQGPHLYKTKSITCHLTHDDNLRYFN